MNWFTKEYYRNANSTLVQEGDLCPHLEEIPNQKVFTTVENDSFGVVGRYSCCSECNDQLLQEEEDEYHQCHDCCGDFSLRNGVMWKSYDHCPLQGNEPLFICNDCRVLPTHKARVKEDVERYEQEVIYLEESEDEE